MLTYVGLGSPDATHINFKLSPILKGIWFSTGCCTINGGKVTMRNKKIFLRYSTVNITD